MTSTTRFPSLFCHARRARRARLAVLALVLAAAAAALTGCSQEGRSIQNALPVPGLAYDMTGYTRVAVAIRDTSGTAIDSLITLVMDVRLKLQTEYRNGCEARGGIELRSIPRPDASPLPDTLLYVVTPLAHYTADEACNIGVSGDTLQTITIRGLTASGKKSVGFDDAMFLAYMEVRGLDAPPIAFNLDLKVASLGADSTLYDIRVEDVTTGLPLDGALVSVQRSGTPNILGEGTTADGGLFAFSVASAGEAGAPGDPYVVKVSYAGRITLFSVIDFPSLSRRREAIIVRV